MKQKCSFDLFQILIDYFVIDTDMKIEAAEMRFLRPMAGYSLHFRTKKKYRHKRTVGHF